MLAVAEAHHADSGYELRGFLSEDHGFLPRRPTAQRLPPSHRVWDEIAAAQPQLWREAGFRAAAEDLPLLRATAEHLSDEHVRRAATVLGFLAHSYMRSELLPVAGLPPSLQQPWEDVAVRLGRAEAFLQYEDIVLGNWRRLDEAGPLTIDNLDMLVASLRIPAELIFHLAQVEMHARATPLVGSVVRAQEAAVAQDAEALEAELLVMIAVVRDLLEQTFIRISPNAYSTTCVDPVLWGALVAPFAAPLTTHLPGPGGTASPIFHTLDGVLGRRRFDSMFGHEALRLRQHGPPHVNDFFAAVAKIPIADAVRASGSTRLRGLLQTLVDAYAGKRGLIAAHRLKAYGFLELAFKVGRPVTISGVAGSFHDRPWKVVDFELESSREERWEVEPDTARSVSLASREPTDATAVPGVRHVVIDLAHQGVLYRTGDRCGVLPTNEDILVDRTVAALNATGQERVPLTKRWRDAMRHRHGHEHSDSLPLKEFLRFAKLRPVLRPVAKTLQTLADSGSLRVIVEARREDQWELWDLLALVADEGYDVTRLWRAEIWQAESLAAMVPPETFRMYSVSSAPDSEDRGLPSRLHLTVGTLQYRTAEGGPVPPVTRRGTASVFLNETAPTEPGAVPVQVVHPLRFHLPEDPSTPVVMFAGGTGISPFRGFAFERAQQEGAGETWLFFATPSREHLYYRSELERLVAAGALHLQVAFSREDAAVGLEESGDGSRLVFEPGKRSLIDALMERDENAAMLWDVLRRPEEGGRGGFVYICGQAGLAQTVLSTLYRITARSLDGDPHTRRRRAERLVRQMMADGRLMLDVFTTFVPTMGPGVLGSEQYDASEIVLHNDDEHGYWMVVDGNVYDLTEFRHLHPGGRNIVDASAGMDATREYDAVEHHENDEINAMLSMYKIGAIRRLDFKGSWGIALSTEGLAYVAVQDAFRMWARFLYLVLEMQNAFANDVLYLRMQTSAGEDENALSPLKLMLFGNTHARFMELYYRGLLGPEVRNLWAVTAGLCAATEGAAWLKDELERLEVSEDAQQISVIGLTLRNLYKEWRGAADAATFARRAGAICVAVRQQDAALLHSLKMTIRRGVHVFETHEGRTVEQGGDELLATLRSLPGLVAAHQRDLCTAFAEAQTPSS